MPELYEIVGIVKKINRHIISNRDVINTEGIMRLSGTKDKRLANIARVLENEPLMDFSIHELADVYKHYLQFEPKELISVLSKLENYSDTKEALSLDKNNASQCSEIILKFINDLCDSKNLDEFSAFEIIYSYFHLATKISEHSKKNMMGTQQMGVILGPFITTLFNIDAHTLVKRILCLNQACQNLIESGEFKVTYAEKHPVQNMRAMENQLQRLKRTESEKSELSSKIKVFNDELSEQIERTNGKLKILNEILERLEENPKENKAQIKALKESIHSEQQSLQNNLQIASGYQDFLHKEQAYIGRTLQTIESLNESYEALVPEGKLEKTAHSSAVSSLSEKRPSPVVNTRKQKKSVQDQGAENKIPKTKKNQSKK